MLSKNKFYIPVFVLTLILIPTYCFAQGLEGLEEAIYAYFFYWIAVVISVASILMIFIKGKAMNSFRKVQIAIAAFASLAYSMAVDWDESDLVKTHLIRLGILTVTSTINIFVLVKNNNQPDEDETDDASAI
jgi:hypothetical protein